MAPEGLRVTLSSIVDVQDPDGTIARLPASFRLWYPSHDAIARLVEAAGLAVAATHGSHDLEAFSVDSERLIVLCRRIRHRSARRGWNPNEATSRRMAERIRLLMVEDVPQVASHVRSLLIAQTQIQIVEVIGDGERALAAGFRPDVVIIDWLLQGRVRAKWRRASGRPIPKSASSS